MKKSILLLTFAFIHICGFSQTFQYEAKSWKALDAYHDNGDNTSSQTIDVTIGIVGEPYGFLSPDMSKNVFIVVVPNKTKDIDWIKEYINEQVILFVKQNYPDVK